VKSIIMAGGSGTRLWPLSRKNYPKQFLSLIDDKSFINVTAERLLKLSAPEDIYVVAGEDYKLTIAGHLSKLLNKPFTNLIMEPMGRNTAPAIALTIKYLLDKEKVSGQEILFFSPSDHIIKPVGDFTASIMDSIDLAKDNIVTYGIVPSKPETGYGYVELGGEIKKNSYKVKRFVEKPDLAKANEYLKAGNYLWNSGMFLFSIDVMLSAFQKLAPELYRAVKGQSYEEMLAGYSKLESISIDYAVMEKADNIVCGKMAVDWNDVGSWDSVYEIFVKDKKGNALSGDVLTLDVENSLVISREKLTALIGVSNLAVIETDDAILVSDRSRTQDVKEMVNILNKAKRPEATEHTTTFRPWGSYTVLEASDRYKIKKIVVEQGQTLSLQRHAHRSEHWVVVKGTALVTVGDKEIYIHENESTFIPKSVQHRLSNPGKVPLEIIEVQNGEYVGEDDIERLEDNYGRVAPR
jgi:mannose-1-phosphate guanylyltransferase / mannose-6-phosphate isomerase